MGKTINLFSFLRRHTKYIFNLYSLTILCTTIWMLLFDRYDLISQYRMANNIRQLEADKMFYYRGISHVKAEYDILLNDPRRIERFARENYWMKRPDEDVYVFTPEK